MDSHCVLVSKTWCLNREDSARTSLLCQRYFSSWTGPLHTIIPIRTSLSVSNWRLFSKKKTKPIIEKHGQCNISSCHGNFAAGRLQGRNRLVSNTLRSNFFKQEKDYRTFKNNWWISEIILGGQMKRLWERETSSQSSSMCERDGTAQRSST